MSSEIDELYSALAELHEKPQEQRQFTPQQERVLAGFAEINRFYAEHGRKPQHGADRDIFERIYAARLAALTGVAHWRDFLAAHDPHGLLSESSAAAADLSLDELAAELNDMPGSDAAGITRLVHVRAPAERAATETADDVAERTPCRDFAKFKPLFDRVQTELSSKIRAARKFEGGTDIKPGEFFILGGQKLYIAEKSEMFKTKSGEQNARLRLIFDNGTESNMLMRSLQSALYKPQNAGRRITEPTAAAGPLFGSAAETGDVVGGVIYVLESCSDRPEIAVQKDLLHKIGVTGGDVRKRIINAKKDPTFLMAEVEIVREYSLINIQRRKLEALIHKFFAPAQANITIRDRFGEAITPKEWFFAPLPAIDEAVERIKDGTLPNYYYDPQQARLVRQED